MRVLCVVSEEHGDRNVPHGAARHASRADARLQALAGHRLLLLRGDRQRVQERLGARRQDAALLDESVAKSQQRHAAVHAVQK